MKIMTQVEDMKTAQSTAPTASPKRKVILSPELDEVLHMLRALEGDQGKPGSTTRS
jgi:hypothetical protein